MFDGCVEVGITVSTKLTGVESRSAIEGV